MRRGSGWGWGWVSGTPRFLRASHHEGGCGLSVVVVVGGIDRTPPFPPSHGKPAPAFTFIRLEGTPLLRLGGTASPLSIVSVNSPPPVAFGIATVAPHGRVCLPGFREGHGVRGAMRWEKEGENETKPFPPHSPSIHPGCWARHTTTRPSRTAGPSRPPSTPPPSFTRAPGGQTLVGWRVPPYVSSPPLQNIRAVPE